MTYRGAQVRLSQDIQPVEESRPPSAGKDTEERLFFRKRPAGKVSLKDNLVLAWQRRLRKVFIVLIAVAVVWFFVQVGKYKIPPTGDTMKGTFDPGKTVIYDRLFDWHDGLVPFFGVKKRGILRRNVVLFLKKEMAVVNAETGKSSIGDYYGISRVIGLPGDTVRFVPGGIVIGEKKADGKFIDRMYYASHPRGSTGPEVIPPDRFFILNDNVESQIQDSRHFGYVRGDELEGKVIIKIW